MKHNQHCMLILIRILQFGNISMHTHLSLSLSLDDESNNNINSLSLESKFSSGHESISSQAALTTRASPQAHHLLTGNNCLHTSTYYGDISVFHLEIRPQDLWNQLQLPSQG